MGEEIWQSNGNPFGGGILGTLLLWVIHLLPVDRMRVHVYQSLSMLREEFTDSLVIKGYEATLTGSFTDCLMLENTIYYNDAHSTFEQAMMMYRKEIGFKTLAFADKCTDIKVNECNG